MSKVLKIRRAYGQTTYALFFILGLPLVGSLAAAAAMDDPGQAPIAADAPGPANAPEHSNGPKGATQRVLHQGGPGSLDERVRFFTTKLNLDATQQAKLRRILADQRDAVRKIWSNPSLSPAERAPATRAANERTGDEIRSILNDEQKAKYNPPAPATPPPPGDKRTVEQWLDATRPR